MNTEIPSPCRILPDAMIGRGLKPVSQLAAVRPHGDRVRYLAGCRCDLCRQANTEYERSRQRARRSGDWNGIIDATKAREHLIALSAQGVGRRAVSAATDISDTILFAIRTGRKQRIRARTEKRILAVTTDMASDHALIDAAPTWQLIADLKNAGFSYSRIAAALGNKTRALQIAKNRVTVRKAAQVVIVHAKLMSADEALVPAAKSLRLLKQLRDESYTEKQLARELELPNGEYVIPSQLISVDLQRRIERVHARLMA